ncbi:MAG: hypothetical protein HYZ37_10360 [Candidatus Solibacter usitatus]|nr:hypothetical protein [Candidatus Solibacter usitatus]
MNVIFESALRSMAAVCIVWLVWKAFRIRSAALERALWILMIAGSLLMPLLTTTLQVTLVEAVEAVESPVAGEVSPLPAPRSGNALWYGYCAIAGVLFARILIGLFLALRLRWRSVAADLTGVRISSELRTPVVVGGTILLPLEYMEWSEEKLSAVLAHERTHVSNGDFFLQIAARVHAAIFWFNPLTWWLMRRLAELSEIICDQAALSNMRNGDSYAALLLEFSSRADPTPLAVAMARPSSIGQRIERILAGMPHDTPLTARRWMLSTLMIGLITAAASVSIQRVAIAAPQPPPPPPQERKAPPPAVPVAPSAVPAQPAPPPPPPARTADEQLETALRRLEEEKARLTARLDEIRARVEAMRRGSEGQSAEKVAAMKSKFAETTAKVAAEKAIRAAKSKLDADIEERIRAIVKEAVQKELANRPK